MQFEEIGNMSGKTLMLLPGTCCDWQGFAIAFGLMVWIGAYKWTRGTGLVVQKDGL